MAIYLIKYAILALFKGAVFCSGRFSLVTLVDLCKALR
ncbi:Unannotated [Lentimonas sp. CC4]|nr:Unannotated [Lentimonas sp. CC4]CAA6683572.1 Unannotated [Lentimonas sp. CC6]CAA7077334.1 Unannotated [Lentimonas sp. CC4]CAA7170151.1 Unannotated [Lentimonas sp. CC21]CAA7182462.1 Unannotated [Lentimonas sp. CC8]